MYKNLCFCMFFKEAYTYNHMKRYVPIVIGVVALCAVLYLANNRMEASNDVVLDEQATTTMLTTFNGSITRMFEGENVLQYGFDLPETSTTTVEKDGALIKVMDSGMPVVAMYVSFEGGRGYSPSDYISNVIVPNVKSITDRGTTTIGSYDWTVVESPVSVWHVASVNSGNWLLVVENRKTENEKVASILESLIAK